MKFAKMKKAGWGILVCVALLWMGGCIKKPKPPSWDINLNLPIADTTIYVRDLIQSGPIVTNPGDSVLVLDLSFELDTLHVDEYMTFDNWDTTLSFQMGSFSIYDKRTEGTGLCIADLHFPAWMAESLVTIDSVNTPVPPLPTDSIALCDSISELDWCYVNHAKTVIYIKNDFPIPIDPFQVNVYTCHESDTFHVWEVDTVLPSESTVTFVIDTSNFYMGKYFVFDLKYGSPGTPYPVWIHENDSIKIWAEIDTVEVESARAYIDTLRIEDSTTVCVETDIGTVDSICFDNGYLDISLENVAQVNAILDLQIPEFDIDTILFISNSNQIEQFGIPLAGRSFHSDENNSATILYRFTILPAWYTLRSADEFSLHAELRDISISYFKGILDTITVEIPPLDTTIDIPDGLQNISFSRVFLSPFITNTIGISAQTRLFLEVSNEAETRSDTIILEIPESPSGEPVEWDTVLDIADLLQITPNHIHVEGDAIITGSGIIRKTDYIYPRVDINAPLSVIIRPDTIATDTAVDTTVIDTSIGERLKAARLTVALGNRMPLGLLVKIHVKEMQSGDSLIRVLELPAAPVAEEGWATRDTSFIVNLELSGSELEIFQKKPRKSWVDIILPGTDDIPVTIRASDYVSVKAFASFKVRIEE